MAMSKEHKEALAQGRLEARSVKAYLDALGSKKRGRPVTKESLQKKLSNIDSKLKSEPNPLKRLDLMQTRGRYREGPGERRTHRRSRGTGRRLHRPRQVVLREKRDQLQHLAAVRCAGRGAQEGRDPRHQTPLVVNPNRAPRAWSSSMPRWWANSWSTVLRISSSRSSSLRPSSRCG